MVFFMDTQPRGARKQLCPPGKSGRTIITDTWSPFLSFPFLSLPLSPPLSFPLLVLCVLGHTAVRFCLAIAEGASTESRTIKNLPNPTHRLATCWKDWGFR